ncbi:MAG: hypothetical protein RXO22_03140 [Thermocladium sp.]|jgi:hypothetical protein
MKIRRVRPLEVIVEPDPAACLISITSRDSSTRGRRTQWGTYLLDDYIEIDDAQIAIIK